MDVTAWLQSFVAESRALGGLVYRREGTDLHLRACVGFPSEVGPAAQVLHPGQGLAGLALERKATLSTCTGRVGRRAFFLGPVPDQNAVALPVQDGEGEVEALVYVLFSEERRLRDDELVLMLDKASWLVRKPPLPMQPCRFEPTWPELRQASS